MALPLVPDFRVNSVYDLTPQRLQGLGKRLVLADLDNTIARYRQREPEERLFAWKRELNAAGITVFILSNGRKPNRSRIFATAFGVDFIKHAGKPKVRGFRAALERTGFTAGETIMVGDQIFTDIWGANRAGITSVLTEPIVRDTAFRRLRYLAETPFRTACHRYFTEIEDET